MRTVAPGEQVIDQFPVYESDGWNTHSGLHPGEFVISTFHDGEPVPLPVILSEVDSCGQYRIVYTPTAEGYWEVQVLAEYNKDIWRSAVVAELSQVSEDLRRILGLLHHNAMLDKQVYDSNGQLTSARLRVFDTASHVPTIPGGNELTGLIQVYHIQAAYAGANAVTQYTLKQVL